jgi:hypothetical protein
MGVRLGDLSGFNNGLRCDGRTRLTIAAMASGSAKKKYQRKFGGSEKKKDGELIVWCEDETVEGDESQRDGRSGWATTIARRGARKRKTGGTGIGATTGGSDPRRGPANLSIFS